MDLDNPIVTLCGAGAEAETRGEFGQALALYQQAWDQACTDYERCIAAHYLARHQDGPELTARWNLRCLELADRVAVHEPELVAAFHPSLHLNLGKSYEDLQDPDRAEQHYRSAGQFAAALPSGDYRELIVDAVSRGLSRIGR